MDDVKAAMLGNKEAAKRLTEKGGCCRARSVADKQGASGAQALPMCVARDVDRRSAEWTQMGKISFRRFSLWLLNMKPALPGTPGRRF